MIFLCIIRHNPIKINKQCQQEQNYYVRMRLTNANQALNSIDEEISASGNPKFKHKLNQTNIFSRTNVDRLTSSNSLEINQDLLQSSRNSDHMIRINVTQVIF